MTATPFRQRTIAACYAAIETEALVEQAAALLSRRDTLRRLLTIVDHELDAVRRRHSAACGLLTIVDSETFEATVRRNTP